MSRARAGSSEFPALGPGISLRRSFLSELADRLERGDATAVQNLSWAEAVPENFIGRGGAIRHALLRISEAVPIALHGTSLSIGSVDPLDEDFLEKLGALAKDVRARWVSDHVCFSSAGGAQFHNLLPLPFSREAVRHVVKRVGRVKRYLGLPFALENPSYYATLPGSEMSEADFITEIVEKADCGLLLDINNVYVNCVNHHSGPPGAPAREREARTLDAARRFLKAVPLERVMEVHIAGHESVRVGRAPMILDTHGAPVASPVRALLTELHALRPVTTLLLERESNVPPLDKVLAEAGSLWAMLLPTESAAERAMDSAHPRPAARPAGVEARL